jgi:hypothetical protein
MCEISLTERVQHTTDVIRQHQVPITKVTDDPAAGRFQGFMPVRFAPAFMLGMIEESHARVFGDESGNHSTRLVIDAVADDEDFDIPNRLPQDAPDRIGQERAAIPGRWYNDSCGNLDVVGIQFTPSPARCRVHAEPQEQSLIIVRGR